jgi:CheY-like chemotaxis protein/anti-sigma regulatory factor (Ser/Thr protein kinase)
VLRSALDTAQGTAAEKKIDVEFVDATEPLIVEGDSGRLQQVFANVLSNALKFTPPSGRVRVIATRNGNSPVVRISDSGEGIAAQFLPHIFDMFRQQEEGTRRRHTGLGIGLAVVKRLVDLHQGRIEITSGGAGMGTEATIRLPLATQARTRSSALVSEPGKAPPFHDLTILLVEDTEDSLDATRIMLEVLGAEVLVARDGIEALDVMATSSPDLVLCDLRMPRMDGFEFLRELCRIQGRDHPPVVAVSGLVSQFDHQHTQAAGFEGWLPYKRAWLPCRHRRRNPPKRNCELQANPSARVNDACLRASDPPATSSARPIDLRRLAGC